MSLDTIWVVTHDASAGGDLARNAHGLAAAVNAVGIGTGAVPGADLTLTLESPGAGQLLEGYAGAVADLLTDRAATVVLFGTDVQSRLLAGLVAARLGTSPRTVAEVTGTSPLTITRMAYGGLAVATEQVTSPVAVLVVGPGALAANESAGAGAVEAIDATPDIDGMRLTETRAKGGETVNLAAAKRVVGVGRGFADEADLALAQALADKLGAELACSRPIAEGVNWMPTERYIGVSGATLTPDLYVAIGISGQVQHMVGINKAKVIVAINKDKKAPIFASSDIGVVGDLYALLPELAAAL